MTHGVGFHERRGFHIRNGARERFLCPSRSHWKLSRLFHTAQCVFLRKKRAVSLWSCLRFLPVRCAPPCSSVPGSLKHNLLPSDGVCLMLRCAEEGLMSAETSLCVPSGMGTAHSFGGLSRRGDDRKQLGHPVQIPAWTLPFRGGGRGKDCFHTIPP